MWTELYWVDGLWPGKLALAARPRGGEWLEDEMASWRRAGIDTVLSLLTSEEEQDLDLRREAQAAKEKWIKFGSLPIPDRQVPNSESGVGSTGSARRRGTQPRRWEAVAGPVCSR